MEEIKRDKAPEEAPLEDKVLDDKALDDKALEEASGGLVYPEFLRGLF